MLRSSLAPEAALVFLLANLASFSSAFDLAGAIPVEAFAGERPAVTVETLNDSTGIGIGESEFDDARSYGFQAYGSWRGLALGAALEGFTFRGYPPEIPLRGDELALSAAWMSESLPVGPLRFRGGGGAGLRAWGDFGTMAIQDAWHAMLEVDRPSPTVLLPPSARPFAYASGNASLDLGALPEADLSLIVLILGTGAIETSASPRALWRSGASANWLGLRRDDRLGPFDYPDARANAYERGAWLLWGARTGFLSVENELNLDAPFSFCNVSLRFGDAGRGETDPLPGLAQELAVGASLLEPAFMLSRSFAFDALPELRVGVESQVGAIPAQQLGAGGSHYQEGGLLAELSYGQRGARPALTPFAGAGIGLRSDSWANVDVARAEPLGSAMSFAWKIYAGIRLDPSSILPAIDEALRLDLCLGFYGANRTFPPNAMLIFVRVAVLDA